MKILLSSVKDRRKAFTFEAPFRLEGLEERAEPGHVRIEVDVDPVDDRWHVNATLRGFFPFRCDRCMNPFTGELSGEFGLVVLSHAVGGLEPDTDDALVLLPAGSQELDLSDKIQEALWLDLPIRLSCEAATGKSCPGAVGSKAAASAESPVDPRWGPLAELKKQLEAGEKPDAVENETSED